MKLRELASIAVFLFVMFSFWASNHNNQLENDRLAKTCNESAGQVAK